MADTPTPAQLMDAADISPSYAHMILSGERTPARSLAIRFFRKLGWRHSVIAELTEAQMATFEEVEPWAPREKRAAA